MGIVVIGSVFVDIKGFSTSPYLPTGRNSGEIKTIHGGVARNVAEDIANVEMRPTFVGLVDDTGAGEDVLQKLIRHKVDTRFVRRTPDGMGTWLAVFDERGELAGSISKRPNLSPIGDIIDEQGDEIFRDADSVIIELDLEKEVVKKVFHFAEKYSKDVYILVSNMTIALERRDFLRKAACFVCNQEEAGILFSDDYSQKTPEEMQAILAEKVKVSGIRKMVITLGAQGAVYASEEGEQGYTSALKVQVKDTTGAGDAFFAGFVMGQTYGKNMAEACCMGARLSASVITTTESVCPRFLPEEFGLTER